MIIAGIDPGTQRVGYAVIRCEAGRAPQVLTLGVWDLLNLARGAGASSRDRPDIGCRLEFLFDAATGFFREWNPAIVGLEKAVSFKNIESAHKLSEARGVVRLAVHQNLSEAPKRLLEISPTAVKKQAAGFGSTSKAGVVKSLGLRFEGLEPLTRGQEFTFDAFDALAIAWTTWIHLKSGRVAGSKPPTSARKKLQVIAQRAAARAELEEST